MPAGAGSVFTLLEQPVDAVETIVRDKLPVVGDDVRPMGLIGLGTLLAWRALDPGSD